MTREEFIQQLSKMHPEMDGVKVPTDGEYSLIEHVYMHHPSISGLGPIAKSQIAWLYSNFGIAIVRDMEPRASAVEKKEQELRRIKGSYEKVQQELHGLQEGGEIQ